MTPSYHPFPSPVCRAFRILLDNPEAQLIAIHKGRIFKEPDGLSLGPGPFVLALEHATGKTAQVGVPAVGRVQGRGGGQQANMQGCVFAMRAATGYTGLCGFHKL